MFQVGDEIVYPPYGAGYIAGIEEKRFKDRMATYYVLEFLFEDLDMYVPSKLLSSKNIRKALDLKELEEVISNYQELDYDFAKQPVSKRTAYFDKLLSTADVNTTVNTILTFRKKNREKPLNPPEREIYLKFFNLVVGEIIVAEKVNEKEAEALLNEMLEKFEKSNV